MGYLVGVDLAAVAVRAVHHHPLAHLPPPATTGRGRTEGQERESERWKGGGGVEREREGGREGGIGVMGHITPMTLGSPTRSCSFIKDCPWATFDVPAPGLLPASPRGALPRPRPQALPYLCGPPPAARTGP